MLGLESKITKVGIITIDSLETEHLALRALNKDMYLKLSNALENKLSRNSNFFQLKTPQSILKAKIKNNGRYFLSELIIRTRLTELKAEENRSEQQANIIKSGQVDSWIEEHKIELNTLMHELDEKRDQVKLYSKLLIEIDKQKMERIILNKEDGLDKEISRLKILTYQQKDTLQKLQIYNRNMRETLQQETKSYETLLRDNPEVINLLDQDIEGNTEKYWKLLEKKQKIGNQISLLNETAQL